MNDNRQTTVSRVDYVRTVRTRCVFFSARVSDVLFVHWDFQCQCDGSELKPRFVDFEFEHARVPFLRARGGRTSPPVPSGDVRAMSSSADDLRGSASEPGAAVAPGTPSPFDRLPGEDVPDAGIAGDAATDPSVPPPATPSWFDASAFANPSFDAAAYVDDMSAYVSMDALRDELESYQKHLRKLLVDAVNADYDVFLSLGEGLVDVREVVDAQMEAPIEAFKRDVGATRAEIVELLNDLREKLRRRAECAERRATLELMLDANNVASKVERLLDQLDASGDESVTNRVASEPPKHSDKENKETTWTWEGPDSENERSRRASDAKREESDADADADADAAFESEVAAAAAAAAAEMFSVTGTVGTDGLDALHSGVAADGPSAAALALADEPSRASDRGFLDASSRRASALRERCRLLERVAGEANRSRFFQTQGDEKNLGFVKGLKPRVERSEARLADAVAKAIAEACASRDAVAVARCLSAYVALGRASEAERAIREARVAPAVAEALKNGFQTVSNDFAALLETCVDAALRSVDVELETTSPRWNRNRKTVSGKTVSGGDDDVHAGATSSAANLDARVCVLGGCVLAEIDERIAAYAPGAYTPGAPDAFFKNHLAACAAIDALERALPPTRAALALFRASEPTLAFFKRWNVAAYFALRRREIVTRLDAELEEDRLTRAVAGAEDGAAFATAAAAGTYAALEKCFDTERVFLPRAADKFVKLAAQILARFGGWVVAGATSVAPADSERPGAGREAPPAERDSASGPADSERPDSLKESGESLPPRDTPSVVSWGATASDEDLLRLRSDVEVLAARVETALAPRVAASLARTLGGAAAAAATEVLNDGAASLTRARDSGPADDCLRDGSDRHPSLDGSSVNTRSAAESLDARLASDVVRRCAVALGQLKGVTATFRMTNKPMPTKPSHFANGVVEPLRRFAESGAVREASAPTRRALVDAAVAGVCAAYEKAAADLTVSVRKTEASLIRLKDRKGEKGLGSSATASTAPGSASGGPGPTDAEKICRQVRLDAEAFGRAVARLGFDPEKSDAFAKLWDVCGEGDAFSSA